MNTQRLGETRIFFKEKFSHLHPRRNFPPHRQLKENKNQKEFFLFWQQQPKLDDANRKVMNVVKVEEESFLPYVL